MVLPVAIRVLPGAGKRLSMALVAIDLTEGGTYQPGAVGPYRSRFHAAQSPSFNVFYMGRGQYTVNRIGGEMYPVHVCMSGGAYRASCSCYDWRVYGTMYGRACVHIWRVILTHAVGVC